MIEADTGYKSIGSTLRRTAELHDRTRRGQRYGRSLKLRANILHSLVIGRTRAVVCDELLVRGDNLVTDDDRGTEDCQDLIVGVCTQEARRRHDLGTVDGRHVSSLVDTLEQSVTLTDGNV